MDTCVVARTTVSSPSAGVLDAHQGLRLRQHRSADLLSRLFHSLVLAAPESCRTFRIANASICRPEAWRRAALPQTHATAGFLAFPSAGLPRGAGFPRRARAAVLQPAPQIRPGCPARSPGARAHSRCSVAGSTRSWLRNADRRNSSRNVIEQCGRSPQANRWRQPPPSCCRASALNMSGVQPGSNTSSTCTFFAPGNCMTAFFTPS